MLDGSFLHLDPDKINDQGAIRLVKEALGPERFESEFQRDKYPNIPSPYNVVRDHLGAIRLGMDTHPKVGRTGYAEFSKIPTEEQERIIYSALPRNSHWERMAPSSHSVALDSGD